MRLDRGVLRDGQWNLTSNLVEGSVGIKGAGRGKRREKAGVMPGPCAWLLGDAYGCRCSGFHETATFLDPQALTPSPLLSCRHKAIPSPKE